MFFLWSDDLFDEVLLNFHFSPFAFLTKVVNLRGFPMIYTLLTNCCDPVKLPQSLSAPRTTDSMISLSAPRTCHLGYVGRSQKSSWLSASLQLSLRLWNAINILVPVPLKFLAIPAIWDKSFSFICGTEGNIELYLIITGEGLTKHRWLKCLEEWLAHSKLKHSTETNVFGDYSR